MRGAGARRVDTESLLADAAQQRQRGVGHASRGLRALRVHVHVGAKEHGFGRAGQGGAQIDEGHALRLQRRCQSSSTRRMGCEAGRPQSRSASMRDLSGTATTSSCTCR